MRMVVLSDNISKSDLNSEWGLSCFLEFDQHKILLDTGASDLFIENASKLGVDLNEIEYAILSHAHFDHGNGMEAFLELMIMQSFIFKKAVQVTVISRNRSLLIIVACLVKCCLNIKIG